VIKSVFPLFLIISIALNAWVPNDSTIFSLISRNYIEKNVLLISFGTDAITAINTQKGIVVIDAGISTYLTSIYRRIIEDAFPDKKFIYVINTHAHHDHYGGNSVFPGTRIIGHENCHEEISKQWENPDRIVKNLQNIIDEYSKELSEYKPNTSDWNYAYTQKIRYWYALEDVKNNIPVLQPQITFSDSLHIDMGNVTLELRYFGSFHSNSDVLIYVPEQNLLFTGDLMFKYGRPALDQQHMNDNERWQEGIDWIKKRLQGIDVVIGGHGQVLSGDDLQAFINKIQKN